MPNTNIVDSYMFSLYNYEVSCIKCGLLRLFVIEQNCAFRRKVEEKNILLYLFTYIAVTEVWLLFISCVMLCDFMKQ